MEAEADFVFSICCLDKTDPFSGQKLGDEEVVSFKTEIAAVADGSDLDAVIDSGSRSFSGNLLGDSS
jgi:hypothetical protein